MNMRQFYRLVVIISLCPWFLFPATWTHTKAASEPVSTRPVICVDPLGHLHIAWTANDPYGETLHYATDQSGDWSAQQVAGGSSNTAYTPSITVDRYGFPYIVARFYSYNYNIRYFTNAYATSAYWTGMTALDNAHYHESSIEVDSEGNTHVFAQDDTWGSNVFYQNHDLADAVIDGGTSQFFATAIDPDDVLHFAGSHSGNIWYTYYNGIVWSAPDSIDQLEISTYHPSIACDGDGNLHVVFASSNGIYYTNNTSGTWSVPEQATGSGIFPNVAIDANGKAHIVYYTQVENGGLFYLNNLSGIWSAGELITIINTDGSAATEDVAHVESKIALDLKNSRVNIVYIEEGNTVKVAHTGAYDLCVTPEHDTTATLVSLDPAPDTDSLSTALSGSIDLMNFRISDSGGDGLGTQLQELVFQMGPGMSEDLAFNDVFQQVTLSCSDGSHTECSIYGSKLLAGTKERTWKSIPEGGTLDFGLSGTLKEPLENMDGKAIQVKLNGLSDVIIDTAGTAFRPSSQDVVSDTMLFRVIPDHFIFLNLGDDFYNENLVVGWWMQLQIVDAAGNVATGVSDVDVTLSAVELDGTTPASLPLQSTETLTKTLTNGVVNWNNVTFPASGQILIQASCDLLTTVSDTVTVMPFDKTLLITGDDTISNFLNNAGIAHDYYHEDNYQFPTASKIQAYDHIILCPSLNYIWYVDSTKIQSFLESGSDTSRKSMLALGENGLGNIYDSPFAAEWFGATRGQLFSHNGNGISGVPDDPVSDGVHLSVPVGNLYEVIPAPGAAITVLHEDQTAKTVGTRYDTPGFRTVMITPEFRSLSPDTGRSKLFTQILDWFDTYAVPEYPPALSDLPDINMTEDMKKSIALSDWQAYVTDQDTPLDSLTWQLSGLDYLSYEIQNDSLILFPDTNYFGPDTVVVSVDDGTFSDDDTISVFVMPINDSPGNFNLTWPPDLADIPDTSSLMLSWEPSVDVDDDTLYYRVHLYSGHVDTTFESVNTMNLPLEDLSFFSPDSLINWSVTVSDPDDSSATALNAPLTFTLTYVEVALSGTLPENYVLMPCYPNPFNPTTTLQYGLPEIADVSLIIFDVSGRKIKSWHVDNRQPGWHKVTWDGKDQSGSLVSTGVYIYSLQAGYFVDTKKMVFMK